MTPDPLLPEHPPAKFLALLTGIHLVICWAFWLNAGHNIKGNVAGYNFLDLLVGLFFLNIIMATVIIVIWLIVFRKAKPMLADLALSMFGMAAILVMVGIPACFYMVFSGF